jgi:hypothetical protein
LVAAISDYPKASAATSPANARTTAAAKHRLISMCMTEGWLGRGPSRNYVVETPVPAAGQGRPIALTLKVGQARYEALKGLGARTRRSTQDTLLTTIG